MKLLRSIGGVILLLSLVGCIDVETVVKVRSDGSGVVEERLLMSEELMSLASQMQSSMGGDEAGTDLFNREEIEARAAGMGPGVSLLSVEPLTDEERQGYEAVFAFQDINTLQLNQNPSDRAPSGPGMQGPGTEQKKEPLTFEFIPGPTAELIVRSPAGEPGGSAQNPSPGGKGKAGGGADDASAEMAMAMMKEMFKDLRVAVAIEVEGQIVETNATFQEESRVTLVELDFGKLLENAEKFQEFAERSPETLADAKALMQDIPGIKAELNPEVRIRFTAGGDTPVQHLASGPEAVKQPPALPDPAPAATVEKPPAAPDPAPAAVAEQPPAAPDPTPTTVAERPHAVSDASPAAAPEPSSAAYRWQAIEVAQVNHQHLKLLRVTDAGGTAHKGMLRDVMNGNLTLQRAAMDGGGTVKIPLARVRQVQVFERAH